MKVLFVSSPVALPGIENMAKLPNLGLASIAGNLDKDEYDVRIIDLVACRSEPASSLNAILKSFNPDVVGFSAMTFQYDKAVDLARVTKSFNPDIKILLGGYHATTAFKDILESDGMEVIDYIIRGEGEETVRELLGAIQSKKEIPMINGLSFRNKTGEVINTPDRELINLDHVKLPDRSVRWIDKGFYFFGEKADMIETSRGCTFSCDYCSINCMYGRHFRKYELKRVIEDIKTVCHNGVKFILLADDNITLDTPRLLKLCRLIIKEKLNHINFAIQTGVKGLLADPSLPELMTEAGMKYIFLALENPENQASKFYNVPGFEYDEALRIISEFRKRDAYIMGGFVIGHPDDNEENLWKTYKFAIKSRVDMVAFLALTPFPGTRIREKLLEEGLITNINKYSQYSNVKANIRTHHLSSTQLTNITRKMNARFLLERGTFFRLLYKFPRHIMSRLIIEIFKAPGMLFERLKGAALKK